MGAALAFEGLMSACYHVCPNALNFQFGECIKPPKVLLYFNIITSKYNLLKFYFRYKFHVHYMYDMYRENLPDQTSRY